MEPLKGCLIHLHDFICNDGLNNFKAAEYFYNEYLFVSLAQKRKE